MVGRDPHGHEEEPPGSGLKAEQRVGRLANGDALAAGLDDGFRSVGPDERHRHRDHSIAPGRERAHERRPPLGASPMALVVDDDVAVRTTGAEVEDDGPQPEAQRDRESVDAHALRKARERMVGDSPPDVRPSPRRAPGTPHEASEEGAFVLAVRLGSHREGLLRPRVERGGLAGSDEERESTDREGRSSKVHDHRTAKNGRTPGFNGHRP